MSIAHDIGAISVVMMYVSREAVGVGAGVAALQMHLVRTHAVEFHESRGIEGNAAVRVGIHLRQPTLDPIGIELVVPYAIERIGDVHALAVTADLDHLRRTVQWLARARGM